MHYSYEKFTKFLESIDLDSYRERFSKIKTVEMDLRKEIQALKTIYNIYWNNTENKFSTPPNFDEYYEIYYESCKEEIKKFCTDIGFCSDCDCFPKGLKARTYRTWASLITQVHAGYVAESVFGKNNVEQSAELDYKKIDILVHYKKRDIKIQVKKNSLRSEMRRMREGMLSGEKNGIINILYVVPNFNEYKNSPYYVRKPRTGELRDNLTLFVKYNKDGTLDMLPNGFVIFTTKVFELIKQNADKEQ